MAVQQPEQNVNRPKSAKELKSELDALKTELKAWQNPAPGRTANKKVVNGKEYTAAQIQENVDRLTTQVRIADKTYKEQKKYEETVGSAEKGAKQAEEDFVAREEAARQEQINTLTGRRDDALQKIQTFTTGDSNGYYNRPSQYVRLTKSEWNNIVPQVIADYQKIVDSTNRELNLISPGAGGSQTPGAVTNITPPMYATPPTQLGPQPAPAPVVLSPEAQRYLEAMARGQQPTSVPAPSTVDATQLAQAGIGGNIDWEALAAGQTAPTQPAVSTGGGVSGGGSRAPMPAPAPAPVALSPEAQRYLKSLARNAWLDKANSEFGWVAQLYDTDPSIKALMDKAVEQGYTPERFAAELRSTSWWKKTSVSVRQYMGLQATDPAALRQQVNQRKPLIRNQASQLGLSLSDETINRLADNSYKYGWTELQLANHIGAEAIKEDRLAGGMAGGSTEFSNAAALQNIRNIANDYMINVSDRELNNWTKQILTGKKTEMDFTNMAKARAKIRYSSLTEAIDRGETVMDATAEYRNTAAYLLEVDPDEIDFLDEKFAPAFNYVDDTTGKLRQMNLQEWGQYIRSTPDWQKTENARTTYQDAAFSLARAFGMYQ